MPFAPFSWVNKGLHASFELWAYLGVPRCAVKGYPSMKRIEAARVAARKVPLFNCWAAHLQAVFLRFRPSSPFSWPAFCCRRYVWSLSPYSSILFQRVPREQFQQLADTNPQAIAGLWWQFQLVACAKMHLPMDQGFRLKPSDKEHMFQSKQPEAAGQNKEAVPGKR